MIIHHSSALPGWVGTVILTIVVGTVCTAVSHFNLIFRGRRERAEREEAEIERFVESVMVDSLNRSAECIERQTARFIRDIRYNRQGKRIVWARVSATQSSIIVTVECDKSAGYFDRIYGRKYVAAFKEENIEASLRRVADQPTPLELELA